MGPWMEWERVECRQSCLDSSYQLNREKMFGYTFEGIQGEAKARHRRLSGIRGKYICNFFRIIEKNIKLPLVDSYNIVVNFHTTHNDSPSK